MPETANLSKTHTRTKIKTTHNDENLLQIHHFPSFFKEFILGAERLVVGVFEEFAGYFHAVSGALMGVVAAVDNAEIAMAQGLFGQLQLRPVNQETLVEPELKTCFLAKKNVLFPRPCVSSCGF